MGGAVRVGGGGIGRADARAVSDSTDHPSRASGPGCTLIGPPGGRTGEGWQRRSMSTPRPSCISERCSEPRAGC